jgi:hypothetical protein
MRERQIVSVAHTQDRLKQVDTNTIQISLWRSL